MCRRQVITTTILSLTYEAVCKVLLVRVAAALGISCTATESRDVACELFSICRFVRHSAAEHVRSVESMISRCRRKQSRVSICSRMLVLRVHRVVSGDGEGA